MSELEPSRTVGPSSARQTPAVGLPLSRDDADVIATAILHAKRAGHEVVAAPLSTRAAETEATVVARQIGAIVLDPPSSDAPPGHGEAVRRRVAKAAREAGYPGVVWHADPSVRVDYAASEAALAETTEYLAEAEPAPTVDTSPEILAAVPAYDEVDTVGDVVRGALSHADEVVVVDDGSTDGTVEAAREAGATVVQHDENRGYGGALKTAFREADRAGADNLVVLDADGQHDPGDIPSLVAHQRESGAEVVIGSRFGGGAETDLPLYRRVGLKVVNLLTNLSLGVVRERSRVADTQSGFRAYDRTAIESLAEDDSIGNEMGASTDILYHAHHRDYDVAEVPTTIDYEVENASSQHPLTHGLHLVSNILRTVEYERPVAVLGVPGFVSIVVGTALSYVTVATYVDTGLFPIGIAVLSVFFALAGIFSCFTAIILHSLNTHLSGTA